MGWYSRYVLPKLIDAACGQKAFTELRAQYVPQARGDVLEIGIGSGLNLQHYSPEVSSITGIDPAAELTQTARERAQNAGQNVTILGLSGEAIPSEDARFDSIVCTWTLCSIPNVYTALREMHRVLKPGGKLYYVEHGRSPDPQVARWQRRIEPLWKVIGGGCHLTRKPDELINDAGFECLETHNLYLPGPRFATYNTKGIAAKA